MTETVAPIRYRGHLIHLEDDGRVFLVRRGAKITRSSWPELRSYIDRLASIKD